jgi:hypothetical protein
MQRRDFLKNTVAVAVAAELGMGKANAKVPAHNWGKYDFGFGPPVADRLNRGPFLQYPPDAVIPNDDVVMTTTHSEDVVPNYGKGLVTYITADSGTEEINGRLPSPTQRANSQACRRRRKCSAWSCSAQRRPRSTCGPARQM